MALHDTRVGSEHFARPLKYCSTQTETRLKSAERRGVFSARWTMCCYWIKAMMYNYEERVYVHHRWIYVYIINTLQRQRQWCNLFFFVMTKFFRFSDVRERQQIEVVTITKQPILRLLDMKKKKDVFPRFHVNKICALKDGSKIYSFFFFCNLYECLRKTFHLKIWNN